MSESVDFPRAYSNFHFVCQFSSTLTFYFVWIFDTSPTERGSGNIDFRIQHFFSFKHTKKNEVGMNYQYKYGFSRSMLTLFIGSSLNHVLKLHPFWYGHRASGGSAMAWTERMKCKRQIKMEIILKTKNSQLTAPFLPGKLKYTFGPCLCGIWCRTARSFAECRGCGT